MLDPVFLGNLLVQYTNAEYSKNTSDPSISVEIEPKKIDTGVGGPYANYNLEFLYHLPIAVAVHLSNNQRFAEAQKWFHLVFDPTNTDTSIAAPQRFWTSFVFNDAASVPRSNRCWNLLDLDRSGAGGGKSAVIARLRRDHAEPFDPFVVAATGRARSSGMS